MNSLLRADLGHMYENKRFWFFAGAMIAIAVTFIVMQYNAIDDMVSLDRVIFLPMSYIFSMITAVELGNLLFQRKNIK